MAVATVQVTPVPYFKIKMDVLYAAARVKAEGQDIQEYLDHANYNQLSDEQRFFFLLTIAYGKTGGWMDNDDSGDWERLLRIRVHTNFSAKQQDEIDGIIELARNYGIIFLHEQVVSDRPKLILCCGHGDPMLTHHPHDHLDADTIDGLLDKNPTWVGGVAMGNRYWKEVYKGNGYYQTIVDEGLSRDYYNDELWAEIESLLKPGGVFLARSDVHAFPPPEKYSLVIRDLKLSDKNGEEYIVITKAFLDKSHPENLSPEDLPKGIYFPPKKD